MKLKAKIVALLNEDLRTWEAEHKRVVREDKPGLDEAKAKAQLAYKASREATRNLERHEKKLLAASRWTRETAFPQLLKWAGFTDEDIEQEAHRVPGHDLADEAFEALKKKILQRDTVYRGLHVVSTNAADLSYTASNDVRTQQRRADDIEYRCRRIKAAISDLQDKINKKSARKTKAADRGLSREDEMRRRAAARKRLREGLDEFPLPRPEKVVL